MSPVYSFHDFSFGISICLVLVKEMHPYLITGSPFCDLYFKAFFSLYFPLPFFFSWQKYRPNMMCILLKVQHNLLPLVCLQNKHSKLHDMAFQPSLLLFLCGFFFFFPSSLGLSLHWEDGQELKPERNHMGPCLLPVRVTY